MRLASLQIQSTHGSIGMQTNRPHMEIRQPDADLSIKQEHAAAMTISTTASKLFIDQSEAFADANLKGPLRSSNEFLQRANQTALAYTSKVAGEGDQMMRIENRGEVIPRIAAENSKITPQGELTIVSMPRAFQVKFQYQPSEVTINTMESTIDINIQKNDPILTHRSWQTDIYLRQTNSIHFQVVGLNVNRQL